MEISIAEFAATLAIGVYFWLALLILLHCTIPGGVARRLKSDSSDDDQTDSNNEDQTRLAALPKAIWTPVLTALVFITGIWMETASDYIDDNNLRWFPPFPPETSIRAAALLHPKMWEQYHANSAVIASLERSSVPENQLKLLRAPMAPCETQGLDIDIIYYVAKNRVYAEGNYYDDLKRLDGRIDFARGFTFVSWIHSVFGVGAIVVSIVFFATCSDSRKESLQFRYPRDLLRPLAFVALFFLFFFLARFAYAEEEHDFDQRVFGYYLQLAAP